jgi:hypothetical protein
VAAPSLTLWAATPADGDALPPSGRPEGAATPPIDHGRIARAGQALRIDNWTVAVIGALRDAGVRPLLLKGPAVVEWLYGGDRTARGYGDADVLVAPADFESARGVLRHLGFACTTPISTVVPGAPLRHAECWFRARDHASVDLHRYLHSTAHLDAEQIWDVVSRDAETIQVQGVAVEVPSERVRALHAVLHIRPKDRPGTQAWTDLEQAIAQLHPATWRAARAVAAELEVEATMGALLRLLPAGRPLADELDLPSAAPSYLVVEHDPSAPPVARFLAQARALGGTQGAWVVVRKVFPSPAYVRAGWPFARRGPAFLVAAYAWRLLLAPVRLVEWARFRASSRSVRLHER